MGDLQKTQAKENYQLELAPRHHLEIVNEPDRKADDEKIRHNLPAGVVSP